MIRQLRKKIICVMMAISVVLLAVIFGLVYHFTKIGLETESLQMMQTVAERSTKMDYPVESNEDIHIPYFILARNFYGVVEASGNATYGQNDPVLLREIYNEASSSGKLHGVLENRDLRFLRATGPARTVVVFAYTTNETATLNRLIRTCILISIPALMLFFVASLLIAAWAIKPVEQAWTQQRQFIADASHELKTPLTVILTNAELLKDPECTPATQSQCSGAIITMGRRMRGLVEDLLELARVNTGQTGTAFSAVDYSSLIEDALLPFEPIFYERGLALETAVQDGISVQGNSDLLVRVSDILLDNAQKYSRTPGTVSVTLQKQGRSQCLLSIFSPGERLSPQDCRNIFKRFYRVDPVRTGGSYGLGLSIAESIVTEHKGKIWAEGKKDGNMFYVQLPLLPIRSEHEVIT